MLKPGQTYGWKWLNLFISWAQTRDTGWHNTDILGPHLIGTAYMSGLCPREKLLKLKNSGFLWTWRTEWRRWFHRSKPVIETGHCFAICRWLRKTGSKFHRQYFALKGLSMTMRWAIGANKDRVLSFLTDNEMYLQRLSSRRYTTRRQSAGSAKIRRLKKWLIRVQNLFATCNSHSTAKAKTRPPCADSNICFAAVTLRGHGARKKLNSLFMSHFMHLCWTFKSLLLMKH